MKNGAAALEQLIISFNGKCNPIRTYSTAELKKATANFHSKGILHEDWNFIMYKGVHEDREISVKLLKENPFTFWDPLKLITNEVAVASQMSNHKNGLKLLGCCLESELPILVYEFPAKGNLASYIKGYGNYKEEHVLPFYTKLRIAIGIANAVAYLHHGLSKTFIHRHIQCGHVFLDQDFSAKLSEFQAAIPIPEGKTHVVAEAFATTAFTAQEVMRYGRYTEKSDVFNFGVLLCELLTGKRYGPGLRLNPLEAETGGNGNAHQENLKKHIMEVNGLGEETKEQIMECAQLVQMCLRKNAEERPNMIEVSKALTSIKSIA